MTRDQDDLAASIDELDNITHMAANKMLPDSAHMAALRAALPLLVDQMKTQFAKAVGENPWEPT